MGTAAAGVDARHDRLGALFSGEGLAGGEEAGEAVGGAGAGEGGAELDDPTGPLPARLHRPGRR